MKSKKTELSMSGIVNTNNVKQIKCDCKKCFHFVRKGSITYCKYYDEFSPHRSRCARFYQYKTNSDSQKRPLSKEQKTQTQANKKKTFPWEIS